MIVLAELTALDPIRGQRIVMNVSSANDARVNSLDDTIWWPGIIGEPEIGIRWFRGDFDGEVSSSSISLDVKMSYLSKQDSAAARFVWQGSTVRIWAGYAGDAWPWKLVAVGETKSFTIQNGKLRLQATADASPFEVDVLTKKYLGTGGVEGPDGMKNRVKPLLLGRCANAEPLLINSVDNVYQFSAYGPIQGVTALYERGSLFPPAIADYPTYEELIAAIIPAGNWATCLTLGLIRLSKPAFGVITGDVNGDAYAGMWTRKTGAIIQRIAVNAGVSIDKIDVPALNLLDANFSTLPNQGHIGIYITDQTNVIDVASELSAPCIAQAGVSLLGKLTLANIGFQTPIYRLDAQQKFLPRVTSLIESGVSPPWSYMEMGFAKSWRVHTPDEIAYENILTGIGGIQTVRYPEIIPPDLALHSLYFDENREEFRFEGNELFMGEEPIYFENQPLLASPWMDVQDRAIPEATYQINIIPPNDQTIFCASDGTELPNQFPPRVLTPVVTMGVEDIRTRADVTYTLQADTNVNVVATVNNAMGSSDKGRITVTSGNPGFILLTVNIGARPYGPYKINFSRQLAGAPSLGGSGSKYAEDPTVSGVSSTSFATIAGPMTVTVATGEDIICTAPLTYSASAINNFSAGLEAKWQFRTVGGGSWTDMAAAITGSNSIWYANDYSGEPGSGDFNQSAIAPTAGDYEVQLVAKMTAPGSGASIEVWSGTAIVRVE